MRVRWSPAWTTLTCSAVLFAGLAWGLYWLPRRAYLGTEALYVYCAESLRPALEHIRADYEREFGQEVRVVYGPSQTLIAQLHLNDRGDLFLPADDGFLALADGKALLDERVRLARLQAVVITRPELASKIKTWRDVQAAPWRIAMANPDATAIGIRVKQRFTPLGLWSPADVQRFDMMENVNKVANSIATGASDVGIVWDVVAKQHPTLTAVEIPELVSVDAEVSVAIAKSSQQPAAAHRFVRFLRARDRGAVVLRDLGYTDVAQGDAMVPVPELVVHAGAMLEHAIKDTLVEFEHRVGCRITPVYNGCGILVGQMKTGQRPDLYFACDPKFLDMVKELYDETVVVSSNQLMLIVPKGNPQQIRELRDLAKKDLRVGVGHEQQCALGEMTRETFIRTGTYAAIAKNIRVQSPSGDLLVSQIAAGALDVVVAYRSNLSHHAGTLEGIPIRNIDCATPDQPLAISRTTAHPELCRQLVAALQAPRSRARFEALGFGWRDPAGKTR